MNFIEHETNNRVLMPPPGSKDVVPLPVTQTTYDDGTPAVCSFWQPTDAEIQAMIAGAPVVLTTMGRTHPPVLLTVEGLSYE